jgi:phosphatidylethanolamine-binding protein (PEBP) family uncharacterized protein
MAIGNIPGAQMRQGVDGSIVNQTGVTTLSPYRRPMPPYNTSCHRYYAIVYQQYNLWPFPDMSNASITNWDFVTFARNNDLVAVARNYMRVQNTTNAQSE